jgi:hypothetical protein
MIVTAMGLFFVDAKPSILYAALYFIGFTALMNHLMLLLAWEFYTINHGHDIHLCSDNENNQGGDE